MSSSPTSAGDLIDLCLRHAIPTARIRAVPEPSGPIVLTEELSKHGSALLWLRVELETYVGRCFSPGDYVIVSLARIPRVGDLVAMRVGTRIILVEFAAAVCERRSRACDCEIIGPVVWHLADLVARNDAHPITFPES